MNKQQNQVDFPQFSSLLSSNEHPLTTKSRSSSLPSICLATFSSSDSANLSLESQSDINDIKQRPKSFIEKDINHLNNPQSSFKTNQTFQNGIYIKNKPKIQQTRFASTDLLDKNQVQERIKPNQRSVDDILVQQKQKQGKKYTHRLNKE